MSARAIFQATSRAEALRRIAFLQARWATLHPKPIKNFPKNIDLCLTYLALPHHLWRKVRTTNALDRFFKEIRRRVNPMGALLDSPVPPEYSSPFVIYTTEFNSGRRSQHPMPHQQYPILHT
jgi:transposase-like protein